jgi:Zn finger protein HypA/HybF involved in hydrogenase expression
MPITFHCSSCSLSINVGSYHGFSSDWYNAVYCRHCGTQYTIRQASSQFFDRVGANEAERAAWEYQMRGPSTIQQVVADEQSPQPTVKCEVCNVEGPFGPDGPITDKAPEGIETPPFFLSMDSKDIGMCPRCKEKTMHVSGEWIT